MVVTIPTVIGSMNKAKEKAEEVFIASIERSLNKFIENELKYSDYTFNENKNEYVLNPKLNSYDMNEILLSDNNNITFSYFDIKKYYSKDDLINPKTNQKCDANSDTISHIYKSENNEYYYKVKLDCLDRIITNLEEPEDPDLTTGLIPVVYDPDKKTDNGTGWFVSDIEEKWYDYDAQWWANGVSVSNIENYVKDGKYIAFKDNGERNEILKDDLLAMFVWIPRFSYTIGCYDENNSKSCLGYKIQGAFALDYSNFKYIIPGAIDIKFILQEQKDLLPEGIKYPRYNYTSDNIVPDNWLTHPAFTLNNQELSGIWFGKYETSIKGDNMPTILPGVQSLQNQSYSQQLDTAIKITNSEYNTIGNGHMTSNNEWGAVAYLSQSIYGKYGNLNYENDEKMVNKNNNNNYITGSSGEKASTTGNNYGIYDMNGGCAERVSDTSQSVGTATSETNNWYGSHDIISMTSYSILRGSTANSINTGSSIFIYYSSDNNSWAGVSFRITLTKK